MKVFTKEIEVQTKGKGTYEITRAVAAIIRESGVKQGQVTVFIQHTSASLIIYENADSSARTDLESYFDRLVRENANYFIHTAEGADDMPSHIRMVLTRTSETIPIHEGLMLLGTWQGIFVFEHRRAPHQRNLVVSIIGT